ncbi:hypothetical protein PR048_023691, partial [Dryococelus australis]
MDQVLQDLDGIVSFQYGILVTVKGAEDHFKYMEHVCNRLVEYFLKFLPCLAMIMAPLYALHKEGLQCDAASATVKEMLTSSKVLAHYYPNLPVRLACNASPYGLGAIISH